MSDISNQLIKNSYNYVLQSDLGTGIVYRIGGLIPVNPIFQSGLTVGGGFTYSGAGEQFGYALLTDGTGYAYWGPVSAATPSSGVTSVTATDGLSGNVTTGAITIVNIDRGSSQNIFKNIQIGGNNQFSATSNNSNLNFSGVNLSIISNSANTLIFSASTGDTVTISGGTGIEVIGSYPNFGINFTGSTGISGEYLPLSGGTVTGDTIFTSGISVNTLTANTSNFDSLYVSNFTEVHYLDVFNTSNFYFSANFLQGITVSGTVYTDTISATNYLNYPDSYVTGFSLNNDIITLSQNRPDQYSSFTVSLSAYTGGGLNYYVLPSAPTGVTLNNGDRWFDTTTGAEVVYINDGDSKQWIQPNNAAQSSSPVSYYTASTYSSMIAFGTPANMTIIKVLNDENKSVSNAIYQVWPDGVRMWMAAIQDN